MEIVNNGQSKPLMCLLEFFQMIHFFILLSLCHLFSVLQSVTYVTKHIILSPPYLLFSVLWILLDVTLIFMWMIVYKSYLIDFKGN